MYLVFEYLFYLGLLAIIAGLAQLLWSLIKGRWQTTKYGALAIVLGVSLTVGPAVYSRRKVIDLGPHVVFVDGEKHITLTGWDGNDYCVLELHPERVVLQIANADVTDQTLDHKGQREFANQLGLDANLVSVDNTQAYIGENEISIVIAFRGSQSPASLDGVKDSLLTNARNFLVLPEGRIGTDFAAAGVGARFHRGFLEALDGIGSPLYEHVDRVFTKRDRPVWVTGHLLGGALALLYAWRMHQHFVPIHQVCTFGAPMIGNQAAADAFAREFPDQIYRYVDAGDLVPRLPMIGLLSKDYDHCRREIVVGQSNLMTAAKVISDVAATTVDGAIDANVFETVWGEIRKGMPSHLMGNYLTRLTDQVT